MYCKKCGAQVSENDTYCAKCGYSLPKNEPYQPLYNNTQPTGQTSNIPPQEQLSERSGLVTFILAFFLGYLGIHSFYNGKIGIGIGQLLTLGGCGIWTIVDIIYLVTNQYRDNEGKLVKL